MKRKYDTINEEINRIKSLFTEERLYGGLVEETNSQITNQQSCGDAGGSWSSNTKTEGELTIITDTCKFTGNADYPDEGSCTGTWDAVTSSCTITINTKYETVKDGKKYILVSAEDIEVKVGEDGDDIKWWKVNTIIDGYGYRLPFKKIISDLGATKERNPDTFQKEIEIKDDAGTLHTLWYDPDVEVDADTTIGDVKDEKETGKETLKETFKSCKEKITDLAKISKKSKITLDDYIAKGNEDPTELFKFCVGKFHSKFGRWDFLRAGTSIYDLKKRWFSDLDIEDIKSKGGTIGQRYPIMYGSRKLGVVMKKGRNDYRIRTKMGEDIVKQSGGEIKWKNNKARLAVEKAISMPEGKKIVFDKKLIPHKNYTWARFSLQEDI